VAEADDGEMIEIWGDGTAVRNFIYVDDLIDGICRLMESDIDGPANLGSAEYVSVKQLVDTVAAVSGKSINVRWVDGPVGVQSRNFSNARIRALGWQPRFSLRDGIERTYPWVESQTGRGRGAAK
jgi:nucleoside-diphosphate-sugar epimerase